MVSNLVVEIAIHNFDLFHSTLLSRPLSLFLVQPLQMTEEVRKVTCENCVYTLECLQANLGFLNNDSLSISKRQGLTLLLQGSKRKSQSGSALEPSTAL